MGTGWSTPSGVVRTPGSVLASKPQWNSDVNSVPENVVAGEIYPWDFLAENCPPDRQRDLDYLLGLLDWPANIDPHDKARYFRPPVPAPPPGDGPTERWITWGNPWFSATEFTLAPGPSVVACDPAAYGCITLQGHGTFGPHAIEAASQIRLGPRTADEFFVRAKAVRTGVRIVNASDCEPLVLPPHFGPNRPDAHLP